MLSALLLPAGVLVVGSSGASARNYFQEVTQRQTASLADNLVLQSDLMVGEFVDRDSVAELTKMLAMTNPGVEIYVVNVDGTILDGSVKPADRQVGRI